MDRCTLYYCSVQTVHPIKVISVYDKIYIHGHFVIFFFALLSHSHRWIPVTIAEYFMQPLHYNAT